MNLLIRVISFLVTVFAMTMITKGVSDLVAIILIIAVGLINFLDGITRDKD